MSGIASKVGVAMLSLYFLPLYFQILGSFEYGFFGYLALFGHFFALFDFGFSQWIILALSKEYNGLHWRWIEVFHLIIGVLILFLVLMIGYWVPVFWLDIATSQLDFYRNIFVKIIFLLWLQWPISLYNQALFGIGKQTETNFIIFLISFFKLFGGYIALQFYPSVLFLFNIQILITSLGLFFLAAYFHLFSKSFISIVLKEFSGKIREALGWMCGFSLLTISVFLLLDMDKWIIGKILSLEDFGIFSLLFQIPLGFFLIANAIKNQFFPYLTNSDKDKFYWKFERLVGLTFIPFCIIAVVHSSCFLRIWSKNTLVSNIYSLIFSLLIASGGLICLTQPIQSFLIANKKFKTIYLFNFVAAFAAVLLSYFGAIKYGLKGAAVAQLLVSLLIFVYFFIIRFFYFKIKFVYWLYILGLIIFGAVGAFFIEMALKF